MKSSSTTENEPKQLEMDFEKLKAENAAKGFETYVRVLSGGHTQIRATKRPPEQKKP
jgi:hypothetical protein